MSMVKMFDYVNYFMTTKEKESNFILLKGLKEKIENKRYQVVFLEQESVLVINSEIKIKTAIRAGDFHPKTLPIVAEIINDTFLKGGILYDQVSFGDCIENKIDYFFEKFWKCILSPLLRFYYNENKQENDFQKENLDYQMQLGTMLYITNGKETFVDSSLFPYIQPLLIDKNLNKKINWLELTIYLYTDGRVNGECLLNNEWFKEGYNSLLNHGRGLNVEKQNITIKQFIFFNSKT